MKGVNISPHDEKPKFLLCQSKEEVFKKHTGGTSTLQPCATLRWHPPPMTPNAITPFFLHANTKTAQIKKFLASPQNIPPLELKLRCNHKIPAPVILKWPCWWWWGWGWQWWGPVVGGVSRVVVVGGGVLHDNNNDNDLQSRSA